MTLLTTPQVAAALGVSPRTVKRLLAAGALPSVRLGRCVRIDPDDLSVMIAALKAPPPRENPACHSTSAAPSGGFASPRRTDEKYGKLLKLPTAVRPRNTTTAERPNSGGSPS